MTPNNNHIAPLSPQKGDSIAPNNEASSLNNTKSCSLDEIITAVAFDELSPEVAILQVKALISNAVKEAELVGEIRGLSTFAMRDRKSFRVNSSIMSIDAKDILKDIAYCYEQLAELQADTALNKLKEEQR